MVRENFESVHAMHEQKNAIYDLSQGLHEGRPRYFTGKDSNPALPKIPSSNVVDLDSLKSDPDPAFQVNPDSGFDDQKLKKYSLKFFFLFLIKNCNLLISRPH